MLGEAVLSGTFADVTNERSIEYIRAAMAEGLIRFGLDDLDSEILRGPVPRRFTQEMSRMIYECSTSGGERAYSGIAYSSGLGEEFGNWAVFEPLTFGVANPITVIARSKISEDDPDLAKALEILDLKMV